MYTKFLRTLIIARCEDKIASYIKWRANLAHVELDSIIQKLMRKRLFRKALTREEAIAKLKDNGTWLRVVGDYAIYGLGPQGRIENILKACKLSTDEFVFLSDKDVTLL